MMALLTLVEGGEGPNTELVWLLFTVLVFFLLVIVVGWLASVRKEDQPEVRQEAGKSRKKDTE